MFGIWLEHIYQKYPYSDKQQLTSWHNSKILITFLCCHAIAKEILTESDYKIAVACSFVSAITLQLEKAKENQHFLLFENLKNKHLNLTFEVGVAPFVPFLHPQYCLVLLLEFGPKK